MNLGEPSTSWAPVWNGIVLPNFEPYGALVEDEVTPARGRGPDWTKKTILGQLENTPTGKDVIWETVLALFRLRSLEDEEMKGKLWQQLVSAWMVSALVLNEDESRELVVDIVLTASSCRGLQTAQDTAVGRHLRLRKIFGIGQGYSGRDGSVLP